MTCPCCDLFPDLQDQLSHNCRKYPALQGSEQQLQALIEQTWQQLYAKHQGKLSDERSDTHLQVSISLLPCLSLCRCYTLAAYRLYTLG